MNVAATGIQKFLFWWKNAFFNCCHSNSQNAHKITHDGEIKPRENKIILQMNALTNRFWATGCQRQLAFVTVLMWTTVQFPRCLRITDHEVSCHTPRVFSIHKSVGINPTDHCPLKVTLATAKDQSVDRDQTVTTVAERGAGAANKSSVVSEWTAVQARWATSLGLYGFGECQKHQAKIIATTYSNTMGKIGIATKLIFLNVWFWCVT